MKRRNAETGKLRRPLKRTKITEGMYGSSMLYLKFVMIWATVVMADYMLEFRFEFLWPFWVMLKAVYDSFKFQGIAFSVFFICIALTSDMLFFFFVPLQYMFFAASTYIWIHYVWNTFADKGLCLPTVAVCCLVVYTEGLWRASRGAGGALSRPLAAHGVGYPLVTLAVGAKRLVSQLLRERRQRQVRELNEFYFQLMQDALPETAVDQSQQQQQAPTKEAEKTVANGGSECGTQTQAQTQAQPQAADTRHMNGSLRRCRFKTAEHNGHCPQEHAQLQAKLERLEKHLEQQTAGRERDKSTASTGGTSGAGGPASCPLAASSVSSSSSASSSSSRPLSNGTCHVPLDTDGTDSSKGGVKSSKLEKKEASTLKEERRKNKSKDKDKENSDSHKSTENTKEQIVKDKEVDSTKECVKIKECNSKEFKEKEKERERDRETREKEKEREREREREQRIARECSEELKKVRAELAAARASEAEARRALAAAAAAERQRRADHHQLKQAHASLQHKVSAWRTGERATLERRLGEERRARTAAEAQLLRARHAARPPSGECESESCRSRRAAAEAEAAALRRDVQRARERAAQLQRDLTHAGEQVRSLETRQEQQAAAAAAEAAAPRPSWEVMQERYTYLETSLSAETRVKLDLLSALGEAKRKLHIQEGLISRQDKEIEELKAQMLAVMPTEFVAPVSGGVSKLRLSDGSPLDPNASVYTPKQLALDA